MRRTVLALLVTGLATPHAVVAPAGGSCPTLRDARGDATVGPLQSSDPALDLTAIDLSVTRDQITARLSVLGQPDPAGVGQGRRYEVYVDVPEEGTYVLRASLGNGQARYQLLAHTATGPSAAYAERWEALRDVEGRVEKSSVVINAPRSAGMLAQSSAEVSGRAWTTAADAPVAVGSVDGSGVAVGVDGVTPRTFIFGSWGSCRAARG